MINFKDFINEEVTKKDLDGVERFADKLFAAVGIDVNFTRHFLDRVNDERNKKPINTAELTRLFKQTYKKHGKKIPKLGDDAQAVIHDMETDINMPFVLKYDNRTQEFDLVAKTIMRKKNFMTSNRKLEV
jgi:homoserine dehydrogenase